MKIKKILLIENYFHPESEYKKRGCLVFYLSIEYVCNQVSEGAKKVCEQTKIAFETDLFSQ